MSVSKCVSGLLFSGVVALPLSALTAQQTGPAADAWSPARCSAALRNFDGMSSNTPPAGIPQINVHAVTITTLNTVIDGMTGCATRYERHDALKEAALAEREVHWLETILATKQVQFLGKAGLVNQYNQENPTSDILLPSSSTQITGFLHTHDLMARFESEDTEDVRAFTEANPRQERLLLASR